MSIVVKGNSISISVGPNVTKVVLPNGYSFESLIIASASNTTYFNYHNISLGIEYHYPVVNSPSPCTIAVTPEDPQKPITLRLIITKFGQIPDEHYFDKAFEPILVTGADGNEYNVIPSDQFK